MLLFLGIICILLVGCGGGPVKNKSIVPSSKDNSYVLPKGMKLINVTDRNYNIIGVLTRPMRKDEKAEIYTWYCIYGGDSITIKGEK